MKNQNSGALTVARLSVEGCRQRQARLREVLKTLRLDAALITDPRHVHYFSGYWTRAILPSALFISNDGESVLSAPAAAEDLAVDAIEVYESNHIGTLVDNLPLASLQPLLPKLATIQQAGFDRPLSLSGLTCEGRDLCPHLLGMRRHKDADEVAMIRRSILGCEAAYARAREILKPGITEVEIYAEMLAAVTKAVGEPVGEMGNDFQSGSPGGPPRLRPTQAGELMPLDVSIVVRGYNCDLSRTFAVDLRPTAAQSKAHKAVIAALDYVEQTARAGTSCKQLYQDVFERLDGYNGWSFSHHLGHGIGLAPHEAPRLNPHWDDTLEEGDVITAEPGLYGEDLRAGIRIEQNYLVTATGLERLSSYPTDL